MDNSSCVIVGVQATPARLSQESVAARDMIERYRERYGYRPQTLAADNTYGNGELLQWLDERGIAPYIRVKHTAIPNPNLYGIDKFTYLPEQNCFICPEGKPLKYNGINKVNRTHLYHSTPKRCRDCSQKAQCTTGKYRVVQIHTCEAARQRAHALAQTPEFAGVATSTTQGRGAVRRTEEPDRTAPLAATQVAVRTRAVLPGGDGAEPQTAGAVPQQ